MGSTYALGDENTNEQDNDKEDDDEDNDDTRLALGPVFTLDQLRNGVLAASDEGHVESGHCDWVDFYSNVSQTGPVRDIWQLGIATTSSQKNQARAPIGRVSFRIGEESVANAFAHDIQACASATRALVRAIAPEEQVLSIPFGG